ncbi:hypothetical protein N8Z55_02615 [Pseudomonadales bacterium]|jgi:hypothetical protein|nr:hypothetical protein [Pseudomonadales bacterium]MDB4034181.1 hypothetical protein [Pseudomonadales bacterium]MDB9875988.1 hypothetical protein [Pseudomonadales bacterium]MDC1238635.1 hypothetical protein [Pseudomonadales bacterium]
MIFRWLFVVGTLIFFVGCSDSADSVAPMVVPPSPPTLGKQMDRIGRPAILTALVSTFDEPIARGVSRDAYNAASLADWKKFTNNIRGNLALFDGLDGQCGNQILLDPSVIGPSRYDTFATVLADDRLYLNTTSGSCSQYLGVELDAFNLAANDECGGRTITQDVIDVSYSALVVGNVVFVTDGVGSDNVSQSNDVFPFLGK